MRVKKGSMGQILRDTDVATLRDIGLQEALLGKQMARLRAYREKILSGRVDSAERQVTDHAIVRYLERVEGMDMEAVKDRVRRFYEASAPTEVKGIHRHPDGMQVVISTHGIVVTILPPDAEPGYETH